jgi:antirestriction protein ArdC
MRRYRRSTPRPASAPAGAPRPIREDAPAYRWADLLAAAVEEPGTISRCYSVFWSYSLGNQLAALSQCLLRGLQPGPIATYAHWQALGRQVRKGERALWLCQPVTCRRQEVDDADDGADVYTRFTWRPRWFVLSQTDGAPYTPPEVPGWDCARALAALDVHEEPFTHLNGNAQGYSRPGRVLAINPVATHPARTLLHELGHIVCGHHDAHRDLPGPLMEVEAEGVSYLCADALGLGGADEARGYIQHYLKGAPIEEATARRIFQAAAAVLRAGRPVEAAPAAVAA